jgi:hypothetical protein
VIILERKYFSSLSSLALESLPVLHTTAKALFFGLLFSVCTQHFSRERKEEPEKK